MNVMAFETNQQVFPLMQFLTTVLTIGYLNNLCAGSPEEPPPPTTAS